MRLRNVTVMPAIRDIPIVARLNAPTRLAATRRRKLRKLIAATLVALGVWLLGVSLAPSQARSADGRPADSARPSDDPGLRGRIGVPVPVEPTTAEALSGALRVDVWGPDGTRLAQGASVVKSHNPGGTLPAGQLGPTTSLVVALTPSEFSRIRPYLKDNPAGSPSRFLVTKNL